MTIDVDPTWYDVGVPLEWGAIEEIIPGKLNSYPIAYPNTPNSKETCKNTRSPLTTSK
jgi:hypothetical protein